jgi:hypothetical protein
MKYILLVLVAALLSACAQEEVTYIRRRPPTAEEIKAQTPQALTRAKELMVWAWNKLPEKSFDISKVDVSRLMTEQKAQYKSLLDLNLEYEYDPNCEPGTMAYIQHFNDHKGGVRAKFAFCDDFYNRTLNEMAQTVLHEYAHAVAGSGECRAMLYEYWVSFLAIGTYVPNDYYWNRKRCNTRGFDVYLPGATTEIPASIDDD